MDEQKDWLGRGWAWPIRLDPFTGCIELAEFESDIRQSILIILNTDPGERVMRPDFGSGVHDLIFAAVNTAMLTRLEEAVRDSLLRYEARIEVLGVRTDPLLAADGIVRVEIEYRVRKTNQTHNLVYPFYYREGRFGAVEEEAR